MTEGISQYKTRSRKRGMSDHYSLGGIADQIELASNRVDLADRFDGARPEVSSATSPAVAVPSIPPNLSQLNPMNQHEEDDNPVHLSAVGSTLLARLEESDEFHVCTILAASDDNEKVNVFFIHSKISVWLPRKSGLFRTAMEVQLTPNLYPKPVTT
jgi:hypothetical protein